MSCSSSSSSADSSAPSTPFPSVIPTRLIMVPGDVLSDVGDAPLSVVLDHGGGNVPQTTAEEVAQTIKLRSYPDLHPIPFSVTGISSGRDFTDPKEISLAPTATLSSGWYLLSVDATPAGVTAYSETRAAFPQLGAAITRFSVVSSPVLRLLELGSSGRLIVTFSERILAEPAQVAKALTVLSSESIACTPMPTGFPRPSTQIPFECPAATYSARLHFELAPGLKSALGTSVGYLHAAATSREALIGYDKLVQDVDFSSMPEISSNTKAWRPEVP